MVVSRKSRSLKEVYIFFLSRYWLKKDRKVMKDKKKLIYYNLCGIIRIIYFC